MRIEIDIPKEFEEHFKQDKFKDSFERIMADIKHSLENGDCLCAGRYEYETIEMLEEALENSKTAYSVDKVVEELEQLADESYKTFCIAFNSDDRAEYDAYTNAIEIVKQGGDTDDVCKWKLDDEEANLYLTGCQQRQLIFEGTPKENGYRYCHYCGKKILCKE